MSSRRSMKPSKDRKVFRESSKPKSVNTRPILRRGGFRL